MFKGIPRGVIARDGRKLSLEDQAMPLAAFMPPERISGNGALAHDGTGVFLGVMNGLPQPRVTDRRTETHIMGGEPIASRDDRHMITVAGSRAGKGRSVVIPTLLTYEGSVLATDPKGELATITARRRKKGLRQATHVIDPFAVTRGYATKLRARFNPMAILKPDSPTLIEDAGLIADAIVLREVNPKDPHWDESARGFIEGVILHVATAPGYEGRRNLATVRDLIAGSRK